MPVSIFVGTKILSCAMYGSVLGHFHLASFVHSFVHVFLLTINFVTVHSRPDRALANTSLQRRFNYRQVWQLSLPNAVLVAGKDIKAVHRGSSILPAPMSKELACRDSL